MNAMRTPPMIFILFTSWNALYRVYWVKRMKIYQMRRGGHHLVDDTMTYFCVYISLYISILYFLVKFAFIRIVLFLSFGILIFWRFFFVFLCFFIEAVCFYSTLY